MAVLEGVTGAWVAIFRLKRASLFINAACLQLFYVMSKAILLPQNEVNAFTFVWQCKFNLFMPFLTVIPRLLYTIKQTLFTRVVCYLFNKRLMYEVKIW